MYLFLQVTREAVEREQPISPISLPDTEVLARNANR